jgi:hypothetical protein
MKPLIEQLAQHIVETMVDWNADSVESTYCPHSAEGPEQEAAGNVPIVLSTEARGRIRELRPTPEEIAAHGEDGPIDGEGGQPGGTSPSGSHLLGRYYRMNPLGRIELYTDGIGSFFWHLIADLSAKHSITARQLSRLAEATVAKTTVHELFHHRSDIMMVMFGTRPLWDRLREEALAVASSHLHVSHSLSVGPGNPAIPEPLRQDFLDRAYRYSAPGYSDWTKYSDRTALIGGYIEHWVHPNALRLLRWNGLPEDGSDLHPFGRQFWRWASGASLDPGELVEIHPM